MKEHRCKDCPSGGRPRAAPHPGPRCASHHRARRRAVAERAASRRAEATYGVTAAEYDALYKAQGGRCAICQRATGRARRLVVDHDHSHCPGGRGCRECVRGLLCSPCNRFVGRLRDSAVAFARGAVYLASPPARAVLGEQP